MYDNLSSIIPSAVVAELMNRSLRTRLAKKAMANAGRIWSETSVDWRSVFLWPVSMNSSKNSVILKAYPMLMSSRRRLTTSRILMV